MLVAWVVTLYPLNMPKMDFTSMVNPYLYTVVPVVEHEFFTKPQTLGN